MSDCFDHEADAYDRLLNGSDEETDGPYGYYPWPGRKVYKTKTCNRCGEGNLHWVETSEGWRLFNMRNEQHVCCSGDVQIPVGKMIAAKPAKADATPAKPKLSEILAQVRGLSDGDKRNLYAVLVDHDLAR